MLHRIRRIAAVGRVSFGVLLFCLLLSFKPLALSSPQAPPPPTLEFLGQAAIASSVVFAQTPVGGLSGITYDAKRRVYYAISDDRSLKAPARFYTLKIGLTQGRLHSKGVQVVGMTPLLDTNQKPFPRNTIDAEGVALSPSDQLWISSEGDAAKEVPPFIRAFSLQGKSLQALPIPVAYQPRPDQQQGIRNNLGFESLSLLSPGKTLMTATENALEQDGTAATEAEGSPARILRYSLTSSQVTGEFIYKTDPIPQTTGQRSSLNTNGLVDLLALAPDRFWSLERAFTPSTGFRVQLFTVSLQGANNIAGRTQVDLQGQTGRQIAQKKRLLDLNTLKIPLDNLEGMTWGPKLRDGRRLLILISDNNFSPLQITQILAFAVSNAESW